MSTLQRCLLLLIFGLPALALAQPSQDHTSPSWSQNLEARVQLVNTAYASIVLPGYKALLPSPWPADDDLTARPETPRAVLDMAQGRITSAGSDTSVAIDGKGFFVLEMPDGQTAYTRRGDFTWADGVLQLPSGSRPMLYPLTPEGKTSGPAAPITMTLDPLTNLLWGEAIDLRIEPDGTLNGSARMTDPVTGEQATTFTPKGQFLVATFDHPELLTSLGESSFVPNAASGRARLTTPGKAGAGITLGRKLEEGNNSYLRVTEWVMNERTRQSEVRRATVFLVGKLDQEIEKALSERGLMVSWSDPLTTVEARNGRHFVRAGVDLLAQDGLLAESQRDIVRQMMRSAQPGLILLPQAQGKGL